MHHYGEDFVTAVVDKGTSTFTITLTNHVSGAQVKVMGPLSGVYETRDKVMDQASAEAFGRELAHFLRQKLL